MSSVSFCLPLDRGGEKESRASSCLSGRAVQTSGLVSPVFSRQTVFSVASVRLLIKRPF